MKNNNIQHPQIAKKIFAAIRQKLSNLLLVFLPVAAFAESVELGKLSILLFSALAIVPFAGLIGDASEVLGEHTGLRIGGLLNATLGNAAELIITIFAIREGMLEPMKASITGSILGNFYWCWGCHFYWEV